MRYQPQQQKRDSKLRQDKKRFNPLQDRLLVSKSLKSIRLLKLSERNDQYKNISILEEVERYDDDKQFYQNFPKIMKHKFKKLKTVTSKSQQSQEVSNNRQNQDSSEESYENTESQVKIPSMVSTEQIVSKQKIMIPTDNNIYENLIPSLFSNCNNKFQEINDINIQKEQPQDFSPLGFHEITEKENETNSNSLQIELARQPSTPHLYNDPYQAIIMSQNQFQIKSQLQNDEDKFNNSFSEKKKRQQSRDHTINWGTVIKQLQQDQEERAYQLQQMIVNLFNESNKKNPKIPQKKKESTSDVGKTITNQKKNGILFQGIYSNNQQQQEDVEEEFLSQYFKNNPQVFKDYKENQSLATMQHLFGKFCFAFDQLKEFQIYYPKNNFTNVIKAYKKIQNLRYIKYKYKRGKLPTDYQASPQNYESSHFQQKRISQFNLVVHKKCEN